MSLNNEDSSKDLRRWAIVQALCTPEIKPEQVVTQAAAYEHYVLLGNQISLRHPNSSLQDLTDAVMNRWPHPTMKPPRWQVETTIKLLNTLPDAP